MEDVLRLRRRRPDPQQLVVETIQQHAESLLRVARRHAGSQADAEDAYQRALEIFVKSAHRLDPSTVHKWLHTVVKHEALAVRGQRARYVAVDDHETLERLDDGRHLVSVEERSERFDDLARAAEALKRLKPQEVTALVLKAQGLSYNEIAEHQGWTYTKVNRCVTEGRRAFLARYEGIRSGSECERWTPILSAIADGEASAGEVMEARPHLRNCPACRSTLAGIQRSGAQVAALMPVMLLAPAATAGGGMWDRLGELALGTQERLVAPLVKAQSAIEATTGTKLAAVAASTVAIAGSGVAVEHRAEPARGDDRPVATRTVEATTASSARGTTRAPSLTADDPSGAAVARARVAAAARQERERRRAEERAEAEFAAEAAEAADARNGGSTEPAAASSPPPTSSSPPSPPPGGEFDVLGGG